MLHALLAKTLRLLPAPFAQRIRRRFRTIAGGIKGSYAAEGEDRLILEFFGNKSGGTYVDVGANDPILLSNTFALYRKGWRGVTVEPVPYLYDSHRKYRPADTCVNAGVGPTPGEMTFYEMDKAGVSTFDPDRAKQLVADGERQRRTYQVKIRTLQDIIDSTLADKPVDVISIDTEGFDLGVVESADWTRFRPALVVYEHNGDAAAEKIKSVLEGHGYVMHQKIRENVFMRRSDVAATS